MAVYTCECCGAAFRRSGSRMPRYCSVACKSAASRTTSVCQECGESFEHYKTRQAIYCSVRCKSAAAHTTRRCPICGITYTARKKLNKQTCGSRGCAMRYAWRSRERSGLVPQPCSWCQMEFLPTTHTQRFCSVSCANAWQGREKTEHLCEQCGQSFRWSPSRSRSGAYNIRFCSIACRDAAPDVQERLLQMRIDQAGSAHATAPERALYGLLDELLGEEGWQRQYLFAGKFLVDAAVEPRRLALQADGDYWHGWGVELVDADERVKKRMLMDVSQDAYMRACGGTVVRFWEHELTTQRDDCLLRLREALASAEA